MQPMRLHLLHWFYKFAPKGLQHEYQQLNDCICTYTVSDKLDYSNNLQEINDRKDHPATNENYNNISLPLLVYHNYRTYPSFHHNVHRPC